MNASTRDFLRTCSLPELAKWLTRGGECSLTEAVACGRRDFTEYGEVAFDRHLQLLDRDLAEHLSMRCRAQPTSSCRSQPAA
jgi:hypothetical protein